MQKLFLIILLSLSIFGCNMNPNKEARIQELESKIEQNIEKTSDFESRIQTLESVNKELESRILVLEKQ